MATEHLTPAVLRPDWPALAHVRALVTLRNGGYSSGPYTSFNLAMHTDDDPAAVYKNRALLRTRFNLPNEPVWLQQVHSDRVIEAVPDAAGAEADGSWSRTAGQVCVVMTADCLPVLICNRRGTMVAAVHAGWRGLQAGVITHAVSTFTEDVAELMVWLGPAIGPKAFEVGADVVEAFTGRVRENATAFSQIDNQHWLCDIYALARIELVRLGITSVYGGGHCTYTDEQRFYSYRRDNITGRMASIIWLE